MVGKRARALSRLLPRRSTDGGDRTAAHGSRTRPVTALRRRSDACGGLTPAARPQSQQEGRGTAATPAAVHSSQLAGERSRFRSSEHTVHPRAADVPAPDRGLSDTLLTPSDSNQHRRPGLMRNGDVLCHVFTNSREKTHHLAWLRAPVICD